MLEGSAAGEKYECELVTLKPWSPDFALRRIHSRYSTKLDIWCCRLTELTNLSLQTLLASLPPSANPNGLRISEIFSQFQISKLCYLFT
jgi:hypothetical protein